MSAWDGWLARRCRPLLHVIPHLSASFMSSLLCQLSRINLMNDLNDLTAGRMNSVNFSSDSKLQSKCVCDIFQLFYLKGDWQDGSKDGIGQEHGRRGCRIRVSYRWMPDKLDINYSLIDFSWCWTLGWTIYCLKLSKSRIALQSLWSISEQITLSPESLFIIRVERSLSLQHTHSAVTKQAPFLLFLGQAATFSAQSELHSQHVHLSHLSGQGREQRENVWGEKAESFSMHHPYRCQGQDGGGIVARHGSLGCQEMVIYCQHSMTYCATISALQGSS